MEIQRHLDLAALNAKRNKILLRAGRENNALADPSKLQTSKVRIQCEAFPEISSCPITERRSIL